MNIKTVCFIFARGGSKGIKDKNLQLLHGKSLLVRSIEIAFKIKGISRVIVSTDSNKIAHVALENGAEVPFIRPSALANDTSPEWLSWQHAVNFIKEENSQLPKFVVSLPPTSPLRSVVDVENCIQKFLTKKVDGVVAMTRASRNPFFNMVVTDKHGFLTPVCRGNKKIYRRQDAPTVYDLTTLAYILDPNFILERNSLFEGRIIGHSVPRHRAVDIDDIHDMKYAEFLMAKQSFGKQ